MLKSKRPFVLLFCNLAIIFLFTYQSLDYTNFLPSLIASYYTFAICAFTLLLVPLTYFYLKKDVSFEKAKKVCLINSIVILILSFYLSGSTDSNAGNFGVFSSIFFYFINMDFFVNSKKEPIEEEEKEEEFSQSVVINHRNKNENNNFNYSLYKKKLWLRENSNKVYFISALVFILIVLIIFLIVIYS